MRWILLVLLLLNGGFFAWQYYGGQGQPMADQSKELAGEYDPLTLISELSDEQRRVLGVTRNDGEAKSAEEAVKPEPAAEPAQEAMAAVEKGTVAAPAEEAMTKTEEASKKEDAPKKEAVAEMKPPAQAIAVPETAKKASPPDEKKQSIQSHCYALGPMKNQKLLNRVQGRVTAMGLAVEGIRNEVEQVPTNWIYLGPIKTEAEAKRTLQRLHSKGVKDTQLINKGANHYVISVGLFSTKEGADERLKRLQDAGFTPSISQVTAKKSHYWLDVSYMSGKQVDKKILEDMVRGISGAGVKEIECKVR